MNGDLYAAAIEIGMVLREWLKVITVKPEVLVHQVLDIAIQYAAPRTKRQSIDARRRQSLQSCRS